MPPSAARRGALRAYRRPRACIGRRIGRGAPDAAPAQGAARGGREGLHRERRRTRSSTSRGCRAGRRGCRALRGGAAARERGVGGRGVSVASGWLREAAGEEARAYRRARASRAGRTDCHAVRVAPALAPHGCLAFAIRASLSEQITASGRPRTHLLGHGHHGADWVGTAPRACGQPRGSGWRRARHGKRSPRSVQLRGWDSAARAIRHWGEAYAMRVRSATRDEMRPESEFRFCAPVVERAADCLLTYGGYALASIAQAAVCHDVRRTCPEQRPPDCRSACALAAAS